MTDDQNYGPVTVEELAIKALTRHLGELVAACLGEDGKPKAPSHKDLMRARACLPRTHELALEGKG